MRARKTESSSRAVIYARYSSHNQREASIEQQVNACRALAEKLDLVVLDVYEDKAITGKTDRRPNFQRMMKDAEKGKFDLVLAWKSNRIGRNMLQAMTNEARLKDLGIRTLYAEEDFDDTAAGRFALRNMMNVNQFYSENMAEDITRGLMDNASKCLCNGSLPLGYMPAEDRHIILNEAEAPIVQEIFSRVACYEPFADIAQDLNRRGIRTKKGAEWNKGSFHSICHNERYRGIYIYGDVRVDGGIPRIISDDLFYRVQEVLKVKKNPQNGRHRTGHEDYLLTGKLFCGHCGSPMSGISGTSRDGQLHYYYICQKRRKERACQKKNVRREQIEQSVGAAIKQQLLTDEVIEWMADQTMAYNEKQEQQFRLQALQSQLQENKTALTNLMKAIEMGIITETTKNRLVELEQQQGQIIAKIEVAKSEMVPIDREDLIALLHIYKDGDLSDKKYLASLFDAFLVRVDLYDDHLKIWFSPTGNKSVDIPLSADSSENNVDSTCQASLSDRKQMFVLAPHYSTTKTGLQCSPVFLLLFSLFLQQKSARHKMPCAFYVAYSASSQKTLKVR